MVKTIVSNYYCGWHLYTFLKHGKLIKLTSSQWLDWYSYVYTDPSISPRQRGEFDGFSKNKIFSTKQTLLNFQMMGVEGELLYLTCV